MENDVNILTNSHKTEANKKTWWEDSSNFLLKFSLPAIDIPGLGSLKISKYVSNLETNMKFVIPDIGKPDKGSSS